MNDYVLRLVAVIVKNKIELFIFMESGKYINSNENKWMS